MISTLKAKKTTLVILVGFAMALSAMARVVDNFDDNIKTAWSDFPVVDHPSLLSQEQGGQFVLDVPQALVMASDAGLFTCSVKTSEEYAIREGVTLEYRVDLTQGAGNDAYAVLAFVPNGIDPKQTLGYSLAKSADEIILVKALNHYFIDDDTPAATVKHQNVTLVLTLTGRGGNVVITGKVLDKDAQNAVLWEKTVTDTPGIDFGNEGELGAIGQKPFIDAMGSGRFALYLYAIKRPAIEDTYRAAFDNAEAVVLESTVVDDFNDNKKTDWTDYPVADLPFLLPQETGGAFVMDVPQAAVGASDAGLFTASLKTSREYTIQEGEPLEFSVDLTQGSGNDAYAVLAFSPQGIDPKQTLGYSLAKSANEIILVKALDHYFIDDDTPEATVKHENVKLVLSLVGKNGNVVITGKVLDKDNQNAVLWEKTVTDTPGADFGNEAELGAVAQKPFIAPNPPSQGKGSFALYLYAIKRSPLEDNYRVAFDNATVQAPPVQGNQPPVITDVLPKTSSSFLAPATSISFKAADDQPLADNQISIELNGTAYTTANGLTLSGDPSARTVSLAGKLEANVNYTALLKVVDAGGVAVSTTIYFDTFATSLMTIEAEDYNFDGGSYYNNPIPIAEGLGPQAQSYSGQTGVSLVDYNDTRTTPNGANTMYRLNDPVRMQHTYDVPRKKFQDAGGTDSGVFDYDVGDLAADEWIQYTRDFPAGSYEVYLRQSLLNIVNAESHLQLVTGDRTQPDAATQFLGTFLAGITGFNYRNFPLTDGSGQNKIVLKLSGPTTLRLKQITPDPGDGSRFQNYLVFIPVADTGVQRATVSEVNPAADSIQQTAFLTVQATIANRDTTVDVSSVKLDLNGQTVPATVTSTATGATVRYSVSPLPSSDAMNLARVYFKDNQGTNIETSWKFAISYYSLKTANRQPGPGKNRGFNVRMVQAVAGEVSIDSPEMAEKQLAGQLPTPPFITTNTVSQLVNWTQDDRNNGNFQDPNYPDALVPGLELYGYNGDNDFSVEMTAWLELKAGGYRLGILTDDGFKLTSGATLSDQSAVMALNDGTSNLTLDFVAPVDGFYPFRLIWYERAGNAYAEWFSVDPATGARTLINDPASPTAIKAWTDIVPAPAVTVESSVLVSSGYAADATAVVDTSARRVLVPINGNVRFYRLAGPQALKITSIQVQESNVVMTYE
ncbi:MAG TPA: hypothetical protein P5186_28615 [Candidatus Paceibacterota bacterium]|nr:hypothetical protein [Verrucomicrobiota bacterium]HRY52012.1 hypothetical protein [Candidatus Paceibacterota bacterium]HSA00745.1 hypothetical protein [Candidatus Paceibacterota bacterium]